MLVSVRTDMEATPSAWDVGGPAVHSVASLVANVFHLVLQKVNWHPQPAKSTKYSEDKKSWGSAPAPHYRAFLSTFEHFVSLWTHDVCLLRFCSRPEIVTSLDVESHGCTETETAALPPRVSHLEGWVQPRNGISRKLSGWPLIQVPPWGTTFSHHTVCDWPLWLGSCGGCREGIILSSAVAAGMWGRQAHVPFNTDKKG